MACFWWAVGTNGDGTSWVKAKGVESKNNRATILGNKLLACSSMVYFRMTNVTQKLKPHDTGCIIVA